MSLSRRIGRFYVAHSIVDEMPEAVMQLMAKCIVVECQLHYAYDRFEYWAISPDFDEATQGEIVPEYDARIEAIDDEFKVSFVRIAK